jgi:hypothetical protein
MTSNRAGLALTIVNLVVLALIIGRDIRKPLVAATHVAPSQEREVLRGRAIELVDANGRVRSRLNVEEDGEVVFRMIDRSGTIRVKLGAGESGSGLVLMDETTEPAVHVIARRTATSARPTTTSVTVRGATGQSVIRP